MWPPPLPTEEIRRLLGSEPWCFPQQYIDDYNRDGVFDYYITKEVMKRGKKKKKKAQASHREIFFAHGRRIGHTWLQTEAAWQSRFKAF